MSIRRIIRGRNNFFLTKLNTKPIRTEFEGDMKAARAIGKDLVDTLTAYNGVGLSAIQINEHKRIIAIKPDKEKPATVMINPVILETSEEMVESDEACLSLPGLYGKVKRHKEIKVSFTDLNNNTIEGLLYDLESFIVQHEVDHLNLILFTDKCDDIKERKKWE